jgi:hypothetical protein
VIEANVAFLRQDSYVRFIAENPQFIALVRQRAISYWDCYFRATWHKTPDHVAFPYPGSTRAAPDRWPAAEAAMTSPDFAGPVWLWRARWDGEDAPLL